jgi:hypothetical protein
MAWIPNPEEVLTKVFKALKPGGKMVIHEYFDWSTHQTEPSLPHLNKVIAACLKSFKDQPGDIDVGRQLSQTLTDIGMKIVQTRPMLKMARPHEFTWQWPLSFYNVYFPRLTEMGFLSKKDVDLAFEDIKTLSDMPNAQLCCPSLIEIIAEK